MLQCIMVKYSGHLKIRGISVLIRGNPGRLQGRGGTFIKDLKTKDNFDSSTY